MTLAFLAGAFLLYPYLLRWNYNVNRNNRQGNPLLYALLSFSKKLKYFEIMLNVFGFFLVWEIVGFWFVYEKIFSWSPIIFLIWYDKTKLLPVSFSNFLDISWKKVNFTKCYCFNCYNLSVSYWNLLIKLNLHCSCENL